MKNPFARTHIVVNNSPPVSRITPNRGDSPCVCGAIHPCCRFLVDGGCAHTTPGEHHHAPSRMFAE